MMDPRDRPTTADDFDPEDDIVLRTEGSETGEAGNLPPELSHRGKRMLPQSFGNRKHRLRIEAEFRKQWRKA